MCDDVAVVYAGEIIESGSLRDLFQNPQHPYTLGLFGSIPRIDDDSDRLHPIDGLRQTRQICPPAANFLPDAPMPRRSAVIRRWTCMK